LEGRGELERGTVREEFGEVKVWRDKGVEVGFIIWG